MVIWQGKGEAYGLLAELLAAEYGLAELPERERAVQQAAEDDGLDLDELPQL